MTPSLGRSRLSGVDSLENYQSVLRTLQYANVSDDPDATARSIDVVVNDGEADSNVATSVVTVVPFNDAPDIDAIEDAVAYVGVEFETTVTVTDPDSDQVTVILDDESPAGATISQVDATTWLIRWTPTELDGEGPFSFRVNATDDGVPVGADSESFVVTLGNPLAQADLNGPEVGFDYSVSYTEGDGEQPIFSDQLTVADPTDTELVGATVTITNLADGADESLTFDTAGTLITGTYDGTTGILTLTGTDSLANYEAVLKSIRYQHVSENPTAGDRIIQVALDDGTDFGPISTSTVTVNADNDAPDLVLPGDFGDPDTPVPFTLGDTVEFVASVTDPDNDPVELTFMLDLDNSGIGTGETMPVIGSDGAFSWTPSETGCFEITVIVTDGAGGADQETFMVQVDPVPEPLSASTVPATTASPTEALLPTPDTPAGSSVGAVPSELPQAVTTSSRAVPTTSVTWVSPSSGTHAHSTDPSASESDEAHDPWAAIDDFYAAF